MSGAIDECLGNRRPDKHCLAINYTEKRKEKTSKENERRSGCAAQMHRLLPVPLSSSMCSPSVDGDNKTCKTVKLHLFIYFDKTLMQVGIAILQLGDATCRSRHFQLTISSERQFLAGCTGQLKYD